MLVYLNNYDDNSVLWYIIISIVTEKCTLDVISIPIRNPYMVEYILSSKNYFYVRNQFSYSNKTVIYIREVLL